MPIEPLNLWGFTFASFSFGVAITSNPFRNEGQKISSGGYLPCNKNTKKTLTNEKSYLECS